MFRCVIVALAAAAVRSATAQSLDDFAKAGVQAGIIGPGGVVPAVDLKTLISVTYFSEGGVVTPYCTPSKPAVSFDPTPAGGLVIDGTQAVTMAQKMSSPFYTKDMPQITWTATDSQMYTLFLQDMDGGFTHYMAMNLHGNSVTSAGQVIHGYFPPLNYVNNRANRYVWLLFEQSDYVTVSDADLAQWTSDAYLGRAGTNVTQIADTYGLGAPVGINWQRESVDAWVPGSFYHVLHGPWVSAATKNALAGAYPTACNSL